MFDTSTELPETPIPFEAIIEIQGENSGQITLPCVVELAKKEIDMYRYTEDGKKEKSGKKEKVIGIAKLYLPCDKIIDEKHISINSETYEEYSDEIKIIDGFRIPTEMYVTFSDSYCQTKIKIIRLKTSSKMQLDANTLYSPDFLLAQKNSDVYHYANCKKVKHINNFMYFPEHEIAKLFGFRLCEFCKNAVGYLDKEEYFNTYGASHLLPKIAYY